MSTSYMSDLTAYFNANASTKATDTTTAKSNGYDLTMEDFLNLMMVELQNQTIDDTADTGEMLNQMVQMQMVTALSNMTDTNIMTYASSLVGKEVTIGSYDGNGKLQENVITVIGTGLYNGTQVIFGDDGKTYQLNQIMAVGRLPDIEDSGSTEQPGDSTDKPDEVEKPGEGGDTEEPGDVEKPGEGGDTEEPGDVEKPGEGGDTTETPDVPDDRPTEGTGDSQDTTEEKKDDIVEPTQEVG